MTLFLDQKIKAFCSPKFTGNEIRVSFGEHTLGMSVVKARTLIKDLNDAIIDRETRAYKPKTEKAFNARIGENIRRERGVVCMTAAQLATASGLSVGFISDVENGKRGISSDNLVKIAKAVGAKVEDLLCGVL